MGVVQLDAYVLVLRGKDSLSFIDGLSTNRVEGTCTTVFTTSVAKIIDMVDVIDKGDFIALVGHGPYKEALIDHISQRILGQDVSIGDASASNLVYLSTEDIEVPDNVTKFNSFRGWLIVSPSNMNFEITMSVADYDEYRVENLIPIQGKEITPKVHPLACGLSDLVHESKGCYIGQEILARMRSRGRQGKQLVRLANPVVDATTIGETHSLAIKRIK
jgi:folate-binding protein YgfZ